MSDAVRARIDASLRACVPGAKGLAAGAGALLQMSKGATNQMYRVDAALQSGATQRLCLRVSRAAAVHLSADVLTRAEAEVEVMGAARAAGVTVPKVVATLPRGDALGEGFFMEWLEGETLGQRIASAPELAKARGPNGTRLAAQCVESIANLQKVDASSLRSMRRTAREATGAIGVISIAGSLPELRKAYQGFGLCRPALEYTLAWLGANEPREEGSPVLVHGDFRNGNIMVDEEQGLVAVLDWEMPHLGSRYEDFGWFCTPSWRFGRRELEAGGFATIETLCEAFAAAGGGRLDPDTLRWWAIFGSVKWAVMCLGMGLAFVLNAKAGQPANLEHGVVGRRTAEAELECLLAIAELGAGPSAVLASAPSHNKEAGDSESSRFPADDALVRRVAQLLKDELAPALKKRGDERQAFLARVAANALGIVGRGLELGPAFEAREMAGVLRFLPYFRVSEDAAGASLPELRKRLADELRSGRLAPDAPGLLGHLLGTVGRQMQVDQPGWASLDAIKSML